MARGFHAVSGSDWPNYYQFKNEDEMKEKLIKHIAKLKSDIEWSNDSWLGFFIDVPLKNEKTQGLEMMLRVLNANAINIDNYKSVLKQIDDAHPNLHEGGFSKESHKIIKGIKMFYQNQTNVELQMGVNKSSKAG